MKVTSVDLYPDGSPTHINLSYKDAFGENSYNVKAIDGLDASSGIVPKYYASGGSGKQFYELSLQPKDIVVLVGLNPHFGGVDSYSSLRDDLYKIIATSRTGLIQLRFNNEGTVVAGVTGFVTKLEAPLFDSNPEIKITIACPDPMLRALAPLSVDVTHLDDVNPTITDSVSTAPHGVEIGLGITASTPSIFIKDPDDEWQFTVVPTTLGGFLAGDSLYLGSNYNAKYIHLHRGGVIHPIADSIFPKSVWPVLFPGTNHFKCSLHLNWLAVSYYPTYWGV